MSGEVIQNFTTDLNFVIKVANKIFKEVQEMLKAELNIGYIFEEINAKYADFVSPYPVVIYYMLSGLYSSKALKKFLIWYSKEIKSGKIQTQQDRYLALFRYASFLSKANGYVISKSQEKEIQQIAYEEFKNASTEFWEQIQKIKKQVEEEELEYKRKQLLDLIQVYKNSK